MTLYFVAHSTILVVQDHASNGKNNLVRAGTEEDPRWDVPAHI